MCRSAYSFASCLTFLSVRALLMVTEPSPSLACFSGSSASGLARRTGRPFPGTLNRPGEGSTGTHKRCSRPTVIVGLFIQQAVALFVLKTDAGFSIFHWIATLAADFLSSADAGAGFFFSADVLTYHFFFVNTVRLPIAIRPLVPVLICFHHSSRPSSSSLPSCR